MVDRNLNHFTPKLSASLEPQLIVWRQVNSEVKRVLQGCILMLMELLRLAVWVCGFALPQL
jgi:hypothetical protein